MAHPHHSPAPLPLLYCRAFISTLHFTCVQMFLFLIVPTLQLQGKAHEARPLSGLAQDLRHSELSVNLFLNEGVS